MKIKKKYLLVFIITLLLALLEVTRTGYSLSDHVEHVAMFSLGMLHGIKIEQKVG